MAKLAILFVLLALPITITIASDAPLASPSPSNSFLTPYAAVPSSESPSAADIVDDSDAASIGAPASEYLPIDSESSKLKSAASFVGASFVGMAAIVGAAGYLLV
ncbi:hypothetical protein IEQ34_001446 [Dendrobium chrysotoxum]|uniref:Transmembrane protein n=1 Tax=Dendrobium chrysotoxum TaxID=161865 RepID=A0AAV7HP65_DENCH|nr:hypothetical protein IEQ34_001446 [Dendrobium chrysotoxum]